MFALLLARRAAKWQELQDLFFSDLWEKAPSVQLKELAQELCGAMPPSASSTDALEIRKLIWSRHTAPGPKGQILIYWYTTGDDNMATELRVRVSGRQGE